MNGTADDPRLKGRELLHDGRTVEATVWLDTDETAEAAAARLQEGLRGPELDMTLVAVREIPSDEAKALWDSVLRHLPPDARIHHGGRCVEVRVFLNTSASGQEVRRRAENAAAGRTGLWIVAVKDEIARSVSDPLWKKSWQVVEETVRKAN